MPVVLVWLRLELRRWRMLALLGVLVVLGTAVVLTSVAGARRGASAVDRLLAATAPGTAVVVPNQPGFDWAAVAALPEVEALTTFPAYTSLVVLEAPNDDLTPLIPADANAMRTLERPVLLEGRLPDPARPDEVVVTGEFVRHTGRGAGDALTLQLPTREQADAGASVRAADPPSGPRVPLRVVGVVRSLWWGDDVGGRGNVIPSPALLTRYRANLLGTAGDAPFSALVRLRHGSADLAAFRAGLARVSGRPDIDVVDRGEVARHAREVTRFESACLLAFGLASLLAAMALVGQVVGRLVATAAADLRTVRMLGCTRSGAAVLGAVAPTLVAIPAAGLGVAAAVVASRWLPFGAAAQREPAPGTDADLLVLGPGWLLVPLLVAAAAAAATWLATPEAGRRRRSALAGVLGRLRAPVAVLLGVRFALEPGFGRRATSVRPALVGSVVGVAGALAAFTFSAGVTDAATHPERFGRTYQLQAAFGRGGQDFGPAQAQLRALAAHPDVAGVTDLRVGAGTSGGTTVVANTYEPVGAGVPIVLTAGVPPAADDEIVLAPSTARTLAAGLGSTVPVTGDRGTLRMRVVGLGYGVQSSTTTYDEGSWVTRGGFDRLFAGFKEHGALLALRPGVPPGEALGRLQAAGGGGLLLFPAFEPVQVREIADVRVLPVLLGGFLILLAVATVGQALVVGVRARTPDLAALRAQGMTPRQARGVVLVQSGVYAAAGLLAGVPLGVAAGRSLWRVAAAIMPLRYEPPVAATALALVVPVALLVAVALAGPPARRVARLRLATALRADQ